MSGKTLAELEGVEWGEPDFPSYLVRTCHELRKKPVEEFTVEDLRIMIGQQIGLDHLMPRAIDVLERQPLAEGNFFRGDLLVNVVKASDWLRGRTELLSRVVSIVHCALAEIRGPHAEIGDDYLDGAFSEFLSSCAAA